jgi:hypothetical protein
MKQKAEQQEKNIAEQGMPLIHLIHKLFKHPQYKNVTKGDAKRLKELALQNLEKVEKTLLAFDKELYRMNGEHVHKQKVYIFLLRNC